MNKKIVEIKQWYDKEKINIKINEIDLKDKVFP
jgi:hypothetical protein